MLNNLASVIKAIVEIFCSVEHMQIMFPCLLEWSHIWVLLPVFEVLGFFQAVHFIFMYITFQTQLSLDIKMTFHRQILMVQVKGRWCCRSLTCYLFINFIFFLQYTCCKSIFRGEPCVLRICAASVCIATDVMPDIHRCCSVSACFWNFIAQL